MDRHEKALEQKLDPDTQALFEKYADCYAELLVEQELEVFKQGFKLGMCFAIEGTDIQTK